VVEADQGTIMIYLPEDEVDIIDQSDIRLFDQPYAIGDAVALGGGFYGLTGATIPEACQQVSADADFTVAQR
jgi:hypothetical protein